MQECECVTIATINSIESDSGWMYNGCKKDFKKVHEIIVDNEKKYWCDKCNGYVEYDTKFKVHIRVIDESGSATFVMFDRVVVQLLGKSAEYIKENLIKVNYKHLIVNKVSLLTSL